MTNITYKNLILSVFGILTIFTLGTFVLKAEQVEAADCRVGRVCGSDVNSSGKNKSSVNNTTQNSYDPNAPCRTGASCGSGIDTSTGNTSAYIAPANNSNTSASNGSNNSIAGEPIIFSISPNKAESGSKETTIAIYGANFTKDTIAKWNSSDRRTIYINSSNLAITLNEEDLAGSGEYLVNVLNRQTGVYSNAVPFTLGGDASGATGTTKDKNDSDLGANALFGAGGFIPFSLLDWILFFILILVGIILWRKVYLTKEKKDAPLKHA